MEGYERCHLATAFTPNDLDCNTRFTYKYCSSSLCVFMLKTLNYLNMFVLKLCLVNGQLMVHFRQNLECAFLPRPL